MKKLLKEPNFYFCIAVAVMVILFISSSQTYEQQSQIGLLSRILKNEPLKEWLEKISFSYAGSEISIAEKGYFSFVEFFIRKGAHFFTYFVLGGSLFLTLVFRKQPYWLAAFFAWLAATGYAGIDEYHQMLTGGRTPLFQDVMLDSAGALTAVLLGWLICQLSKKTPKRRKT
ncbi:VanZ family protein [Enterococcus innesii]|uniref:VanZ family protein n=1 Tax=Enterococcus innesii TaxID=2839759 RepID=UPI00098772FD|nr:VanZ family protein [Enterococcus innesii]OOG27750.1 hypothetical protein BZK37_03065 [Enterococcus casseliflavus]